jgi:hypothetical protein
VANSLTCSCAPPISPFVMANNTRIRFDTLGDEWNAGGGQPE